ncbi:uroporphyrinogen decarboxylase [Babesia caballi]|uniref:Uroporphyrinogen decarboxylase n=1 Tax=Babesia caballi TaxID=5871 RepID=A0AAV4LLU6_BABCB|nr:uroporphyrinogen decarboxylase [Babesia caballi]
MERLSNRTSLGNTPKDHTPLVRTGTRAPQSLEVEHEVQVQVSLDGADVHVVDAVVRVVGHKVAPPRSLLYQQGVTQRIVLVHACNGDDAPPVPALEDRHGPTDAGQVLHHLVGHDDGADAVGVAVSRVDVNVGRTALRVVERVEVLRELLAVKVEVNGRPLQLDVRAGARLRLDELLEKHAEAGVSGADLDDPPGGVALLHENSSFGVVAAPRKYGVAKVHLADEMGELVGGGVPAPLPVDVLRDLRRTDGAVKVQGDAQPTSRFAASSNCDEQCCRHHREGDCQHHVEVRHPGV